MKLYLTHVGRMMLKSLPLLRLPKESPSTISVCLTANQYMKVEVTNSGTVYANDLLAGLYGSYWLEHEARVMAQSSNMEIVGTLEYLEVPEEKGGI